MRFWISRPQAHRLAGVLLILAAAVAAPAAAPERVNPAESAIRFETDIDAALEAAARRDTPVVVLFAAAWCSACQQLENTTLLDDSVQAFADDFIWVRIDIDRQLTVARAWGVDATPTVLFLRADGTLQGRTVGVVAADRFAGLLRAAAFGPASEDDAGLTVAPETSRYSALTLGPDGYRSQSICFSHVGYGPLNIRSQSPFQGLRLAITPRTPSTLAGGQHQLRVGVTWANLWAVDQGAFDPEQGELGPYVFDSETLDVDLEYAYGLSDIFQFELGYEQRTRFGGILDGFIEGFHDLFSIDQSGRDRWPRDQTFIYIDPGSGRDPVVRDAGDGGTIARSVIAAFQHNVTCGTQTLPAISWAATVRSSVGGEELEGDNVDLAISVAASRRFGSFYVYLTLAHTWYGTDAVDGLELEDTQLTVLAAGEWRFRPRMSLVLQYLGSQGIAVDLGPFSKFSHEIMGGWKWELRHAGVLEVGLLQNIVTFDNSPDFGVHAGFTQRF